MKVDRTVSGASALLEMRNAVKFASALRAPILADLPEEVTVPVINAARVIVADQSRLVLGQGDEATEVALVVYGQVEVSYRGPGGEPVTILMAGPGAVLGLPEMLAEVPCAATCTALPGATVLMIARDGVLGLATHPAFVRNLARQYSQTLKFTNEVRVVDQHHTVDQRVCRYILDLADRTGSLRRSQADVATAVGCSRQTVNRVLGELREKGIVASGKGRIQILDRAALLAASDG